MPVYVLILQNMHKNPNNQIHGMVTMAGEGNRNMDVRRDSAVSECIFLSNVEQVTRWCYVNIKLFMPCEHLKYLILSGD